MSNVIATHDLFICKVEDTSVHVIDMVVAVVWTPGRSTADYLTARHGFLYANELEVNSWVVMHNVEIIEFDLASPAHSDAIIWSIIPKTAAAESSS